MNWHDPTVVSALIQSGGGIIATLIAATCAALIGRRIAGRNKLEALLYIAQCDIAYLLAVEAEHCEMHKRSGDTSYKLHVRRAVEQKHGLRWTGRFTPGRLRRQNVPLALTYGGANGD